MSSLYPKDLDYELAKIWLEHQNLSQMAPEQVKELFFDAVDKIAKKDVNR